MVAWLLILPLILLILVCVVALRYVVMDGRLRHHVSLSLMNIRILMNICGLTCAAPMARSDALLILRSQFCHRHRLRHLI